MSNIDSKQYKLLTKLNHNPLPVNSLSKRESEDCEYLMYCGYVEPVKERVICNVINGERPILKTTFYKITPAGRAQRYCFKSTFYKWWIPVVISIAALLISLAALLSDISTQQLINITENLDISDEKLIDTLDIFL